MKEHIESEADLAALETREWIESLDEVFARQGESRVCELFQQLSGFAQLKGIKLPFTANTPYINSIPASQQPRYPGNRELENRIKSIIRWNAMAMVVRANRSEDGIGGHIASYASSATLYEVGYNHFFRGQSKDHAGDLIYFQGHVSPGIYSRAFLEGRIPVEQIKNFRHELHDEAGLSSYPHPWLMPTFWKFPTVSMGLGPIMAIYHARFIKYLEDRGLKEPTDQKIWAFLGDGECDEPETLGAIALAAREKLDNLIFVINCNLQRLDGPVRGNGKMIQELEANFRGVGWDVIKVIWGGDWDRLLEKDEHGLLAKRMEEVVDGQYQKYIVADGAYIRKDFFGVDPRLLAMVEHLSDEQLKRLTRGGHDPEKVYAAYKKASEAVGVPTVILAKTIKGYGMGGGGYGREFANDSSNAVRIEAHDRSNDKGQDFLSQQISDNADRNRDTLRTLEIGNSFERINDKITDQTRFFSSEVNMLGREQAANAREAAKCCCEAQLLAVQNQAKTDAGLATITANQACDTRVADAIANATQNAKLDTLLSSRGGHHGG